MSLTQIEIRTLVDPDTQETRLSAGKVAFNQACVINEVSILNQYNIFWIREGRAKIQVDFETYEIEAETLLFLSPGQMFTVLSEDQLVGFHLAFGSDFYCLDTHHHEVGCNGLLFSNFVGVPYLRLDPALSAELLPHFEAIRDRLCEDELAQTELLQAYLKIFLIRSVQAKQAQDAAHNPEVGEKQDNVVRDFNRLVDKHYREWHAVAEYAEALFLSPKALSKRLSRFNKTPSQVIQDRLVLEAKRQLLHTDRSAKEIAYDLGFEDPAYFSRFFKKKTQLSPSEFKENMLLNP